MKTIFKRLTGYLLMISGLLVVAPASVNADIPFVGEVRWFAGNYAPRGWAFCDGQLLAITSNTALFSLLGTTYGGDGRTTFGLPDLRGRAMVHAGSGPGLTTRLQGERSGRENEMVTLTSVPAHNHLVGADSSGGDSVLPDDRVVSKVGRLRVFDNAPNVNMGASAIANYQGGGAMHNNMQPYIPLRCIIALQGIYPSRQ